MVQKSYARSLKGTRLLGETIGENLRSTCSKFPGREAIVSPGQNYRATYQSICNQVTVVAKALLALNVRKGDRVAIWSSNRYEYLLVQYATARIGAILVNIDPACRNYELVYMLGNSGAAVLISAPTYNGTDDKTIIRESGRLCENLRNVIFLDEDWDRFLGGADCITTEELEAHESTLQFGDPINIQYTSDANGLPKGVTMSHYGILNNAFSTASTLHYSEQDRVCLPAPFYHCFGMVAGSICCTTVGACIVIPSEKSGTVAVAEAIEKEKCTSLHATWPVFTALQYSAGSGRFNLSSIKTALMPLAPGSHELLRQIKLCMEINDLHTWYGTKETSGVFIRSVTGSNPELHEYKAGKLQDHLEIKVIDPDTGRLLERNKAGELCIRGHSVMLGYWNNAKATSMAVDVSGWLHSGNLAIMDDSGGVNFVAGQGTVRGNGSCGHEQWQRGNGSCGHEPWQRTTKP